MTHLLEVSHVSRRFGGLTALEDVTFAVAQGSIVSLIGPNGAGKTTLFNCVTGVLAAGSGDIRFGSPPRSLRGMHPHAIVQCGIARTFQNNRLFGSMSVLENVMAGTYLRTHAGLFSAAMLSAEARREQQWARQRAMALLEEVGLADYAQASTDTLSFGLKRRLEIARAQAAEPSLLLLDEPAAGLNPTEKQQMLHLLRRIQQQGITILLIEHDMGVVMPVSDSVVVLDEGRVIACGPPRSVQQNERVIEAYLGVRSGDAAA